MSGTPPPDMEVEEGSPMGGGECSESPTHLMEPQVELDEDDHAALEPAVELDENIVEPHVELDEGAENSDGNVYPFDTLAVEFYEGAEEGAAESSVQDFQTPGSSVNGLSQDSEDTSADVAVHDNSQCNNGGVDDTSLDADELTMDTSTSEAVDSNFKEDDTNYNELQRTYLEDFYSSNDGATTVDESSNSSFERIPLSRFPSIVKVVERAEYETIQILYQLLFQRSAWDTQEILSKRILDFSGFTFNKSSEEYYNREMLLQTLPNSILVKIGAILCLDQVKNVLSNVGLGRHDLINAIMEFLALPRKKTRAPRNSENKSSSSSTENVEPCGCRNNCLSKFSPVEREFLSQYHRTITLKKKQDAYFLNLIQVNKSVKRAPNDDYKKHHRDYKYNYKIKLGSKEVNVCKGGFMMLHAVKMSKLNQLQLKLKKANLPRAEMLIAQYPAPEGTEGALPPKEPEKAVVKAEEESNSVGNSATNSVSNSVVDSEESMSSKTEDASVTSDDIVKVGDEVKKTITQKVPAVMVEKIDPSKISPSKAATSSSKVDDEKDSTATEDEESKDSIKKEGDNVKKKLKDFSLVVKSMDEASEELLIDLHFLVFLTSADSSKLKENILNFSGFTFNADTEEYDERNEFLQRMSGKLITDVARAFSLGVMSKREETIQNILAFLMKPDESYLRTTASVPVILSDVELDDIEGMSDSDESITCEVVEKKVECIDLLSSGEDSDGEKKKRTPIKTEKVESAPKVQSSTTIAQTSSASSTPTSSATTNESKAEPKSSGIVRTLKDFETIRKIVNTHPPEYLVDIYELLFLKKHEPSTLRKEILDFSGFTFEKGSPEYVKRKQVLDRMLYNNVRRVYNTLIHNSTEVKVFSKPTMINEIFQFLFKLPDHDTSVRPLPPGAKTLMPKQPSISVTKVKPASTTNTPSTVTASPASILPSQTGKLSDLKRVFQRVACFPCEYLVDVHKLLFMTDCDPKVIRQNIFGFKGFSFGVESSEFQQRKMYLEYLTFHSLRKISSVLTTRSVDLRNSTKHELASHLTDVLAEYCNTLVETEPVTPVVSSTPATPTPAVTSTATSTMENIVVTPVIEGIQSVAPTSTSSTSKKNANSGKNSVSSSPLGISIVETRSISSPAVSTSSPSPAKGSRKRKSQTVRQMFSEKKAAPAPAQPPPESQFADIHLPEVEQYRQIYGPSLNVLQTNQEQYTVMAHQSKYAEYLHNFYESWTVSHRIAEANRINMSHMMQQRNKTEEETARRYAATAARLQMYRQFQQEKAKEVLLRDAGDPSVPTITGIASFGSPVPQTFPQIVPQAMTFPLVTPYPQSLQVSGIQQPPQVLGLQSSTITMPSTIITQVANKTVEVIVPADIEKMPEDSQSKSKQGVEKTDIPKVTPEVQSDKVDNSQSKDKDSEEDGDKPLASLIGHPIDSVLKKHICDIVETTDLQDITMNGVIKRIFGMYPKFDLSYRKEFIKSTLRSILYKLGEKMNQSAEKKEKESARDSSSPDCSVTTTDILDSSLPESPETDA